MRYCTSCILPDTRPNLVIGADGVCNACRSHGTKADIDWDARGREPNAALLRWYRSLLQLRAQRPALALLDPTGCATEVFEDARALIVRRDDDDALLDIVAVDE